MDVTVRSRAIWQLGGGPTSRSYADILLKYGVGLIAPGDAGPWQPDRDDAEFDGGVVRRFAADAQIGDVVLLRTGMSTFRAVGLIASAYEYLPQFDDVNGLDLQHARRVRWYALPDEYDFGMRLFGASTPRFSQVNQPEVLDYVERFINSPPTHWQTAPLPALPAEEPALAEIPPHLQDHVAQVHDLAGLYLDRVAFGEYPAEDEMLTHYVVPFLRALGWPVERIAIQWRFIDVAVFRALPRTPENCHFIIEAKRIGAGVEGALGQARGYIEALGVRRDIVVTDGIRYRLYDAEKDFAPVAYANLARLKRSALNLFARMSRPWE